MKKYCLKGGIKRKHIGFKGGVTKNSLKFCGDDICNYANSPPECQKLAFLTFTNLRFSQRSLPPDSLAYHQEKVTNSQIFRFSFLFRLFIFSFVFFSWWWGSSPLIWVTRKGGQKNEKKSYEEGGHHILKELPVESHQPPLHH